MTLLLYQFLKIVFSMIITCVYDIFGSGACLCHAWCTHWGGAREQLCGVSSLLLSLCGFWVQTWTLRHAQQALYLLSYFFGTVIINI